MSGQYQERKEYFKQYREKNKERLQQKRHDYYEENKDRIKEYAKPGKQDNPLMVWVLFHKHIHTQMQQVMMKRMKWPCLQNWLP